MISKLFILLTCVSASAFAAATGPAKFAVSSGKVEFAATGRPSAIKINGEGTEPKGQLEVGKDQAVKGNIDFDLNTLTTGISLRDTHMKEKYLEVGKYPKASVKIEKVDLPKDFLTKDAADASNVPFTGTLRLKDVEHPIAGTCDLKKDHSKISVAAHFDIKLGDYHIDVPKWAGITVAEDVKVNVTTQATKEEQQTSKQ